MKCQLCQKELEAYREGKLPEDMKSQVEAHLSDCKSCAQSYQMIVIADKVISEERLLQSNPFLATRIMVSIENLEQKHFETQKAPVFQKVLKPALAGISIGVALFIGIVLGNSFNPTQVKNKVPVELAYMNDAAMESVYLFSND
jgi:anti-sigma factor RsiW